MSELPTSPDSALSTQHSALDQEDEISLLDLAIVLAKHKKLVLGLPAAAAVVSIIVSLLLPNIYTGVTKILPPQQTSSTSAVLAQLGSLAGLAGGTMPGLKNPNDLYVGMLKSRTVADNLIERFGLNKLYDKEFQSETRRRLENETTIIAGKDGIITITVEDKDPKRAADLANAFVEELFKLTTVLAVTEASQRRLFFEQQLSQAKDGLVKAEAAAKHALEQGGLIAVEAQGRSMVENVARLRAQISVKEVQLGAMRTFAAEAHPDIKLVQQEIEVMKRELAKSEGVTDKNIGEARAGKDSGIDNLGLLRNVKYYEVMYELLARQYETAKLDEAKDSAIIQVMDKAIEPDRKSKPKRALIVILTVLAAGILAILWAFIGEAGQKVLQNPEQSERIDLLRRHIRGK